jgi:hypothetical protein
MELYDSKRKVVLVRGDKSKLYEQAIFILHAGANQNQIDFVEEAEKIINASYINTAHSQGPPSTKQKKNKTASRADVMLNIALLTIGIAIVALLFLNLL